MQPSGALPRSSLHLRALPLRCDAGGVPRLAEERRWISPADFTETIGLCQFLPGPNVGNASVVLGRRWFGWRGSIVAFLGLIVVPFAWVLALAASYSHYASIAAGARSSSALAGAETPSVYR